MLAAYSPHQYIDRRTGLVRDETLLGDRAVRFLYNRLREHAPAMFKALTSARMSSLLSYYHFDRPLLGRLAGSALLARLNIDPAECVEAPAYYNTYRKAFERQIPYWRCRPINEEPAAIASPADSRVLIGSLSRDSLIFIKEKLFSLAELLGHRAALSELFRSGNYLISRLTPDKYHYNHLPVSGNVVVQYEVGGTYHSCNPAATISTASPYSKNHRVVTIFDTDIPGGTQIGRVAMIEIVALMIGTIKHCYSDHRYAHPRTLEVGMFCRKGAPKSLFRPGSSTVILLFEPHRMVFSEDLLANRKRLDVKSRFSTHFRQPLVETDIQVRSEIGRRVGPPHQEDESW